MLALELSPTLRERLASGNAVVALTGAGVSAESGLATFRGPGGMWEGRSPQELATPRAFEADPDQVWRFYTWRRVQAAAATPNPGHQALAAMERRLGRFLLITQNVDGLHERAGHEEVLRLHGSLWRLRCSAGCGDEFDDLRTEFPAGPPRCVCGALLRPGVVWFGEALPAAALARAEARVREASVLLVAGTSGMVYPAAALPRTAREAGAWVVEINPEPTALSADMDEVLRGPAGRVLPLLAAATGAATERRR